MVADGVCVARVIDTSSGVQFSYPEMGTLWLTIKAPTVLPQATDALTDDAFAAAMR